MKDETELVQDSKDIAAHFREEEDYRPDSRPLSLGEPRRAPEPENSAKIVI